MENEQQPAVKVYGKPGCVQCKYTTKELDKLQVPYRYVDITTNEVAHQEVKNLGITSMPVVVSPSGTWGGLHLDKLRNIPRV